jgi:hypothetical protein
MSIASPATDLNRQRQARWRRRQQASRAIFRIEADRDRLIDKLIEAGWLREADSWRRDLVEQALTRAIAVAQFERST